MKRYIQSNSMVSPLKQEANRVFDKLSTYPDVIDVVYVDETDSYEIRFDPKAEDVSYIWEVMNELGYKSTSQDEEGIYFAKGDDYRAWLYETDDGEVSLYISK